ncbi:MAG: hypothetical protein KAT70_08085 [Thermoplasmata archaeon]|nr:hypothetical protein [Thermoplasmata archaeon]
MSQTKNPRPNRTAKSFPCPKCGARPGRECKGTRIPSANSYGGGWGGPSTLSRPHDERYTVRREWLAAK